MWFGIPQQQKKIFFCVLTQNLSFIDPRGRSENQNFFFFFPCRSLQNKYFRRKNYKISLKIDKIIEFYRNHRNPQFSMFELIEKWNPKIVNFAGILLGRNTNYDTGFQKKSLKDRNSKVDFFLVDFPANCYLKFESIK